MSIKWRILDSGLFFLHFMIYPAVNYYLLHFMAYPAIIDRQEGNHGFSPMISVNTIKGEMLSR